MIPFRHWALTVFLCHLGSVFPASMRGPSIHSTRGCSLSPPSTLPPLPVVSQPVLPGVCQTAQTHLHPSSAASSSGQAPSRGFPHLRLTPLLCPRRWLGWPRAAEHALFLLLGRSLNSSVWSCRTHLPPSVSSLQPHLLASISPLATPSDISSLKVPGLGWVPGFPLHILFSCQVPSPLFPSLKCLPSFKSLPVTSLPALPTPPSSVCPSLMLPTLL